jgi:hypothetical protein
VHLCGFGTEQEITRSDENKAVRVFILRLVYFRCCGTALHKILVDQHFGMPGSKPRVILNDRLAAEIYAEKVALVAPTTFESCLKGSRVMMRGKSVKVSAKYGVDAKTIRDIWNRRTWTSATSAFWSNHSVLPEVFCIRFCQ